MNAVCPPADFTPESARLDRAAAVRRIVPKGSLQVIAVGMAMSSERASDYILQAPVLAVAAAWTVPEQNSYAARNHIVRTFAERIETSPKLRDLMAQYGIAYAFRALRSVALSRSHYRTILTLSQATDLHPSALAQAIPPKPRDQARWIRCIKAFSMQVDQRSRRLSFRDENVWAAVAFSAPAIANSINVNAARDLADFYIDDPARWNPKWTFAQAQRNAARWHEQQLHDRAFQLAISLGLPGKVSYAPLPTDIVVSGLRFVALDSLEALMDEGRAMHHCVASYAPEVFANRSRIFSIRMGDQLVATLELRDWGRPDECNWRMQQIRGPYNRSPSRLVVDAAMAFAGKIGLVYDTRVSP